MSDEFVVNDKRLFSKDGAVNQSQDDEKEAQRGQEDDPCQCSSPLPPANFTGLVLGLATSAFINLGDDPTQDQKCCPPDLKAAKNAIDLLAVLQAKTKGNLENEEEALLNTILYDLRMRYIQLNNGKK